MSASTPTDELMVLAEALADLKGRFERVEGEFATQAKPLEAATTALGAVLTGFKALHFHVLDNNLGLLAERMEEQRKTLDGQMGALADELKKADELHANTAGKTAEALRGEISTLRTSLGRLSAQFVEQLGRVEAESRREVEKLSAIRMARGVQGVGEYDPARKYSQNEIVAFLGGSYLSNEDNNDEKPGKKAKKWTQLVARPTSLSGSAIPPPLPLFVTAPATTTSIGEVGTFAYSGGYFYACVAANTWRRCALTTF